MGIFSFLKKSKSQPVCDKSVTAIVVASGSSSRMGGNGNKVFVNVGGRPLISYCLEAFERAVSVGNVIIVTRSEDMVQMSEVVKAYGCDKVSLIIRGGDSRAESVACGLAELPRGTKFVAIHDGARPFVKFGEINAVVSAAKEHGGAILAAPSVDTVKCVKNGFVESTQPREILFNAQTPQVFDVEKLFAAISIAGDEAYTDDSQYFEKAGFPVAIVQGSADNFKITYESDLAHAQGIYEVNNNA